MRFALFGCASTALTAAVIANAWLQRGQFFTACIHLTRSSASLMVLMNMGLYLTVVLGKALQRLFFGPLRAMEVEHLYERSWFAVTETCLAMTIFRDQFDARFIALFALLLLVKIFHWIIQDRVDFMEQSANPSVGWHVRMQSVMGIMCVVDLAMVLYSVQYTTTRGASMMIIFGFEYTILLSLVLSTFVKYLLHSYDLRRDRPWEEKSMYIFYVDLMHDFEKLVTYFCFFAIVVHYYSLPLHIVRDLYMTLRSFVNRCRDLVQYRRATANMNERYPDATGADLAATDRVCIICREEMEVTPPVTVPPPPADAAAPLPPAAPAAPAAGEARPPGHPDTPKKLHCGHIFHFHCLRSWLERQQSCPTCRRSVLETTVPAATQPPANPAPAAGPAGAVNPENDWQAFLRQHRQQFAGGIFNGADAAPPAAVPPVPPVPSFGSATGLGVTPESGRLPGGAPLTMPGGMGYPITLTPLIPLSGAGLTSMTSISQVGVPPVEVLDHLSDAQLQAMEGRYRNAISARIQALQAIQHQITGIITQLTQVSQMMIPSEDLTASLDAPSNMNVEARDEASGPSGSSDPTPRADEKGKGAAVEN
ncbi:E3 ubiquitin-protein ligase hrd1 [Thoreauomyces humboldtii]|nr:E3 ubiquitin-protein ligase hrd1 [Thoreauomyces humboldtii]